MSQAEYAGWVKWCLALRTAHWARSTGNWTQGHHKALGAPAAQGQQARDTARALAATWLSGAGRMPVPP